MEIKAIDTHVHPGTEEDLRAGGRYFEIAFRMFKKEPKPKKIEEVAEEYRSIPAKAVLLAWDAETNTGCPPLRNDKVAEYVEAFPDVFMGFASVDPWKGKSAVEELERAIKELGLRGVKFQQSAQGFYPNDRKFYPLWEKCAELGVPVLFHVGTTGFGAGVPGGMGIRLDHVRPIWIDQVAADFPELTIICAHPAWPWTDEMLAIAEHKTNVWIDLSGWSPKYFPPQLVQRVRIFLKDRTLFGSDHPFLDPKRWLSDFENIEMPDEVKRKILLDNAKRLFNIQ